jgi:hypothetical protein
MQQSAICQGHRRKRRKAQQGKKEGEKEREKSSLEALLFNLFPLPDFSLKSYG